MNYSSINIEEKFAKFSDHWSPKTIAQMNNCHFKLVKIRGKFIWHNHTDTDEAFFVLNGEMTIHLRNGNVDLKAGELFVVQKGIEHNVSAIEECKIMVIEQAGTINTGNLIDEKTAEDGIWV